MKKNTQGVALFKLTNIY